MLNSANYQRNANENYNEVSSQTNQDSLQTINAGDSEEEREPSYTFGTNVIGGATIENSTEVH